MNPEIKLFTKAGEWDDIRRRIRTHSISWFRLTVSVRSVAFKRTEKLAEPLIVALEPAKRYIKL
jgi:hypothetical protein